MSRILVDSGIEWIGKIPCDWNLLQLRNATLEINEKNNPIKFSNILSLTNTLGVVPYEEKGNQGNISKEDVSQYKLAYKNTIIINSMNLKIGSVGLSAYDGCVSPVYYVLAGKTETDIRFINYIFQSDFQKYLGKYGKGILEIREKIPMYDVLHAYIPYPTRMEQIRIANYLDSKCSMIDKTIEDNNKAIKLLEEYKQNYTSDIFNELSNTYRYVKLKYLGSLQNGISAAKEKFEFGNGTFINYGDVYNNSTIPDNPKGIIDLTDSESNIYSLRRGDVLFTRTSETIEEVGMSAVCVRDYPNSAFSGFVIRFRPYKDNMLPEFYKYYFNLLCHRDYFAREMNLVTRASLSQGLLGNMKVVLPNMDKQKQIANKLDSFYSSIDKIIEYRKQIIEKLEEYKKSLIYEVVTGKKEV